MKIKDLYPQAFNVQSWTNLFNIYKDNEQNEYFNLFNSIQIGDEEANSIYYDTHYVSDTDNLYHISQRYYGTVDLWWFIGSINNIKNPFKLSGKTLKVFKPASVASILELVLKD